LQFYRELGIGPLYRRDSANSAPPDDPGMQLVDELAEVADCLTQAAEHQAQEAYLPPATNEDRAALLQSILDDIGPNCQRCKLAKLGRKQIVFGTGDAHAELMFIGEGPGADEDQQGLPFVGRAGQLLTQMINATAMKEGLTIRREDVYICNVVKCRPPENRTPLPDEMETCGQFLSRQLMVIRPKAICALGGTAVKALLGTREGITRLRGNWQNWRDIPVMPTYHPSFLLRPYSQNAKREAWEDLKQALHYVYD